MLEDYLGSIGRRRWQIGRLDCSIFVADWVCRRSGLDPVADVRGRYSSEDEYLRILQGEGGFLHATGVRLNKVGWVRTRRPSRGDVCVVRAPWRDASGAVRARCVGALALTDGLRAVVTSDLGLVIAPVEQLPDVKCWCPANG